MLTPQDFTGISESNVRSSGLYCHFRAKTILTNLICKSVSHSFLLQFIEKAEAREKERLKKEEREVSGGITFVLRLSSSYEHIPGLCSSSTPPGRQENLNRNHMLGTLDLTGSEHCL